MVSPLHPTRLSQFRPVTVRGEDVSPVPNRTDSGDESGVQCDARNTVQENADYLLVR